MQIDEPDKTDESNRDSVRAGIDMAGNVDSSV